MRSPGLEPDGGDALASDVEIDDPILSVMDSCGLQTDLIGTLWSLLSADRAT
jgi:hypothetical protein